MSLNRDLEPEARILVGVCGWRWLRERSRNLCLLAPPASDPVWEVSPKPVDFDSFYEVVDGVPPKSERFSDWVRNGCVAYPRGRENFQYATYGIPPISIDVGAVAMVKAALCEKGYEVITGCRKGMTWASINCSPTQVYACEGRDANEARAVCMAADELLKGTGKV